ncbi:MAG: radical SAM protein [Clostridia bacterium]|nr:radical SAM protein [Clostridia bacterium]
MRTYHIPIFVPHKGCPHDCVFCNQRHITGHTADTTADDVVRIIEENLSTISGEYYAEAAFFGGSFTGIDIDKQTELLEAAYPYISDGSLTGMRCSTRPDYIDERILTNLKKYRMSCIELGVQSTDPEVLALSRRGHCYDDVVRASELIKSYDIELGLQMMLGLPGDNYDKMIKTARDLISLKPSCVRLYPTLVVPDTDLYIMHEQGTYTPLTTEETVEALSEIIPMFERENISIIRVGLQTTDDINENTVKGPYHPAVRELAEGRIIRRLIEHNLKTECNEIKIICNPGRVSQVIGHQKCNKLYFKEKYNLNLKVIADKSVDYNKLKICDKIVEIYYEV